jgi:hypothetical protein
MKRIVKLTESDLARIVRRVLKEQGENGVEPITTSTTTDVVLDCQDLLKFNKRTDDRNVGGSPYAGLEIDGDVKISYNPTSSPNYRHVTVIQDGKPYCKIPVMGDIGDCRDELSLNSDMPGSDMTASLQSPVKINVTGTVAPKDRGTIINDANGYFCMVPSSIVPESRMRRRRF